MSTTSPKIIYKYRDWNNLDHRRLLLDGELFVSSPKDFNDPFDCRISKNFSLLDTEEKLWEFAKRQSEELREFQHRHTKAPGIDEIITDFERKIFERLKFHREDEQKKYDAYTFRKQDEHNGIVSFSEIWDSILMWGHYACNHSGFCVGFFEKKVRESEHFGGGGPVNYSDDFPSMNPLDEFSMQSVFIETHTKAMDWQYEKEYRLMKLFFPKAASIDDRKIHLDKSFFAEIMIGVKFPKDQVKWISDLAFKLGVKLYEIKQIPFRFKLAREENI